MKTTDFDQILKWNSEGIIPGPKESEESFVKRALYLESFKEKVNEELQLTGEQEQISASILGEALPEARRHYGIEPSFTPLFFSNEKLAPWHGGTSWIVQLEKDSPTAAFIQLKKCFFQKQKALLYDRTEIIVHELSHIGRMAFECPAYEEIIAWSSSPKRFRRLIGPLFSSITETSIFVFILLTLFMIDIMALFLGSPALFEELQLLKLLPLLYLVYAGARLLKKQRSFAKCRQNMQGITRSEEKARAIVYRLTDEEISLFSKEKPSVIARYIQESARHSLRWKIISQAYIPKVSQNLGF
ncbi:hypothetical protein [Estrella lausannensis]|uniref:Conserved putative membrane protein n=1 Tax=Estrella lausannensis TaxID=483423 RepID=A0A0H5E698_9BACT|nr:hypothetical protein [Estrella lausannensis]CRX38800.1 Conserved putative membrane protein [Estrella lausannensis]